jgi:hypothetical protein
MDLTSEAVVLTAVQVAQVVAHPHLAQVSVPVRLGKVMQVVQPSVRVATAQAAGAVLDLLQPQLLAQ